MRPEREQFCADLKAGLGWGEAKQRVYERLEQDIAPMRSRYEATDRASGAHRGSHADGKAHARRPRHRGTVPRELR